MSDYIKVADRWEIEYPDLWAFYEYLESQGMELELSNEMEGQLKIHIINAGDLFFAIGGWIVAMWDAEDSYLRTTEYIFLNSYQTLVPVTLEYKKLYNTATEELKANWTIVEVPETTDVPSQEPEKVEE